MKKILLAIFVSLPFLSISQNLKLSDFHIENEDGLYKGTVTVTNTSSEQMDVKVKRTVEVLAEGHITYFCWGECYGPGVNVSPTARTIAAGASDANAFFGDVQTYGMPGVTRVNYCFFDAKNPMDETCYSFAYDVTGLQEVTISEDDILTSIYPNPVQSTGKLGYDLSGKKYTEASVIVRNLTGSVVKSIKLTQQKGEVNINTDQMVNGIYMYSLVVDGKAVLTRKMTVN